MCDHQYKNCVRTWYIPHIWSFWCDLEKKLGFCPNFFGMGEGAAGVRTSHPCFAELMLLKLFVQQIMLSIFWTLRIMVISDDEWRCCRVRLQSRTWRTGSPIPESPPPSSRWGLRRVRCCRVRLQSRTWRTGSPIPESPPPSWWGLRRRRTSRPVRHPFGKEGRKREIEGEDEVQASDEPGVYGKNPCYSPNLWIKIIKVNLMKQTFITFHTYFKIITLIVSGLHSADRW
jgi:hypothetical protein